jgi:hypothetical protein
LQSSQKESKEGGGIIIGLLIARTWSRCKHKSMELKWYLLLLCLLFEKMNVEWRILISPCAGSDFIYVLQPQSHESPGNHNRAHILKGALYWDIYVKIDVCTAK